MEILSGLDRLSPDQQISMQRLPIDEIWAWSLKSYLWRIEQGTGRFNAILSRNRRNWLVPGARNFAFEEVFGRNSYRTLRFLLGFRTCLITESHSIFQLINQAYKLFTDSLALPLINKKKYDNLSYLHQSEFWSQVSSI